MATAKDPYRTLKKLRFAQLLPAAIARGETQEKVALDAGYAPASARISASLNMRKPEIIKALNEFAATAAAEAGLSVVSVLLDLKENKERSMRHVPVLDAKGNPIGEYQYEGAVANRALELIGKHLRMWGEETPALVPHVNNYLLILGDAQARAALDILAARLEQMPPGLQEMPPLRERKPLAKGKGRRKEKGKPS